MVKYRGLVIDALTSIQTNTMMLEKESMEFDDWKDFATEIWSLIECLNSAGFELILILGKPGSGKSYGLKGCEKGEVFWVNCDNKNPTWKGGRQVFGTKTKPNKRLNYTPKTYADLEDKILRGVESGRFADKRYAFIVGHVQEYKVPEGVNQKLSLLGKQCHKHEIESFFETVLYTTIVPKHETTEMEEEGKRPAYRLTTVNSGYNTCRAPEGLFETELIPNDFKVVMDALDNY